jgi:AraC-like DNA-binding protein
MEQLVAQAEALLAASGEGTGSSVSPLPGLLILRHLEPTPHTASLYQPVLCLILQGSKETRLGGTTHTLGAGQALIVSHDVPVQSRIIVARHGQPYLAVILSIDVAMLRGLYEEVGELPASGADAGSMVAATADVQLLDCVSRYLALAASPIERRVLTPLVLREIHFRLLMTPQGLMLRRLLRHDSHESTIARAISRIRRDFRESISVPAIAREVNMSSSSFHKHFRAITSTTPLQYQKQLRLLEARTLLEGGDHSVTSAAFEVGYESSSQFSREYARQFGVAPSSDRPIGSGLATGA